MNAPSVSSRPSRDPLPATARARLLAFQGAANDARDAAQSASARLNTLASQLRGVPALSPEQAAATEQEIARLTEQRTKQNERRATLLTLVDRMRQFLQALPPGAVLEVVNPTRFKRERGESFGDALARVRDLLAVVKQRRNAVATAPLSKAGLKAVAARYVADMGERGRPQLAGHGDGLKLLFGDPKSFVPQGVKATAELLCWLEPERVLTRLEAEIDALPIPPLTMEPSERERRLTELTAEVDRLEREEEALIAEAAGDGMEVLRRPEASPAAVLGVRIKTRLARARSA